MKNATKFCIITIVIGMLLAFTIFTLFANGMLTLDFISIPQHTYTVRRRMLVALLTGSLAAKNEPRLREAYNCCGNLAAVGGACLTLAAFLTSLSPDFSGIPFALGIAVCFSFLYCFWAESCVFFMLIFLSVPFHGSTSAQDIPIHVGV
ncbi:MAG: hypothetical protein ACLUOI_15955 [Eisenbergiella sp.]